MGGQKSLVKVEGLRWEDKRGVCSCRLEHRPPPPSFEGIILHNKVLFRLGQCGCWVCLVFFLGCLASQPLLAYSAVDTNTLSMSQGGWIMDK